MLSKNLYIATTEARSGKASITLGVMNMLLRNLPKVGLFRPIINVASRDQMDKDINLIRTHFKLDIPYEDTYAYTFHEAQQLVSEGKLDDLYEGIISKFRELEAKVDFVLCEGTDFESITSAFNFDINSEIANNLACPVLLVSNAFQRSEEDAVNSALMYVDLYEEKGCTVIGTLINHLDNSIDKDAFAAKVRGRLHNGELVYVMPEEPMLALPSMKEIVNELDAEVIYGKEFLNNQVYRYTVAAMELRDYYDRVQNGNLIITPGDRADIIIGSLASHMAPEVPHVSGMVLTGGLKPEESICKVIAGLKPKVPILVSKEDTFTTALHLNAVEPDIIAEDTEKINKALDFFDAHVDQEELKQRISITISNYLSPKNFEYGLISKAQQQVMHIVLPEGTEDRILRAAEVILRRKAAKLTVLGNQDEINAKIASLNLNLEGLNIIEPAKSEHYEEYARKYQELRSHKGVTLETAMDIMKDESFYGTMMVHLGHADGMVSGSVNTTGHTVRPALQFVKTKPGVSSVSSVFFMCLKDHVIVYGDCAVMPNPTAEELAEIAITSAETASKFGVVPRVAMLSYSTGSSGKGDEVEKVRKATELAREQAPELAVEGPIQYDAAVVPSVAKTKMPESDVAGKATVFIFPDLNTGNNTYKAVQRTANAVAVGPVLQGLNKPINDLSRGCTIPDIINTVAITAIQAQPVDDE